MPVIVVPLSVPVTLTPEEKKPDPSAIKVPDTVRSSPIVSPSVIKVWKLPVVKLAVVPVTVAPEICVVPITLTPVTVPN